MDKIKKWPDGFMHWEVVFKVWGWMVVGSVTRHHDMLCRDGVRTK